MHPKLYALNVAKRLEEYESIADFGRDRIADALLLSTLGDVRIVLIAHQKPNACARLRLLLDDAVQTSVLSKEQAGVHENTDLFVSRLEEASPDVSRYLRS